MNLKTKAEMIRRVCLFALAHRRTCFGEGWDGKKVFAYVAFHALAGTMLVNWQGGQPVAMAILWPGRAEEFTRRAAAKLPMFDWRLPEPGPDIFVAEIIGSRQNLAPLVPAAEAMFPGLASGRVLTFRRDQLCEIKGKERFMYGKRFST